MDCKIKRLHLQAINLKNGIKVFPAWLYKAAGALYRDKKGKMRES
jgi:hypothetical protein